jgi:hypothetical protein
MDTPRRVQLMREKGWRMPADTVKVDRTTQFGNPFTSLGGAKSVELFRLWVTGELTDGEIREKFPQIIASHLISRRKVIQANIGSLARKNLACWCGQQDQCHADVLLDIANQTKHWRETA